MWEFCFKGPHQNWLLGLAAGAGIGSAPCPLAFGSSKASAGPPASVSRALLLFNFYVFVFKGSYNRQTTQCFKCTDCSERL